MKGHEKGGEERREKDREGEKKKGKRERGEERKREEEKRRKRKGKEEKKSRKLAVLYGLFPGVVAFSSHMTKTRRHGTQKH